MTKHCEGCPECVVLFDESGYHGKVPDSHSETCKICPHRNEKRNDDVHKIIMRMHYEDTIDDLAEAVIEIFSHERSDLNGLHPSESVEKVLSVLEEAANIEGVVIW